MDALNFTGGFPSSSDFWPSLAMLAGVSKLDSTCYCTPVPTPLTRPP
jgi:hypothetical protein